ncbi:MAG: DNA-processing protein DprA [Acetobacteraceae bacterium]|nr:DNA-processing protein DprA [Acetobacteraceae bacterium]
MSRPAPAIVDRLRLIRTEGVGPITYHRLLERYGDPVAALEALPALARAGGRPSVRIPTAAEVTRELEQVAAFGARLLFIGDPDYPSLLAATDGAPPVLAVKGDMAALERPAVALVGARNASTNGRHMADLLAYDLASAGLVVVSGLARGIDTAAHTGALRVGQTVAAVAGGIDVTYPAENAELQRRIAEGGAVVAEAPFGTAPQARHFPRRNRVIAGLALAVIVVEAAPRSGSLITARLAAEMGRDLFAVPGSPLDPRCRGSNDLIRTGAHLVESASDVIAFLPTPQVATRMGVAEGPEPFAPTPLDLGKVRETMMECLGFDPTDIDELIRQNGLPSAVVHAALLELELGGQVSILPNNRVCLNA